MNFQSFVFYSSTSIGENAKQVDNNDKYKAVGLGK